MFKQNLDAIVYFLTETTLHQQSFQDFQLSLNLDMPVATVSENQKLVFPPTSSDFNSGLSELIQQIEYFKKLQNMEGKNQSEPVLSAAAADVLSAVGTSARPNHPIQNYSLVSSVSCLPQTSVSMLSTVSSPIKSVSLLSALATPITSMSVVSAVPSLQTTSNSMVDPIPTLPILSDSIVYGIPNLCNISSHSAVSASSPNCSISSDFVVSTLLSLSTPSNQANNQEPTSTEFKEFDTVSFTV